MTDNFKIYREFINRSNNGLPDTNEKGTLDKYYVIEIMRRGKDNPDLPAANVHFKNYYIYSWRDYEKYENEIKELCTIFHMRAYASVNYKLMSQVALDTLAESARRISVHDYKKFYSIFESCSGKFKDHSNNIWLIDIDDEDLDRNYRIVEDIKDIISECEPFDKEKIIMTIPTRSGKHLLTTPFNKISFIKKYKEMFGIEPPTIKENHLTLLYENL